jgi:hypothetical protein
MSDIGLYGICAAMIFGALIVALVLRKWTKHNEFGISGFGLLLVGLVFLTIGVWGSLEITFGDLTLLTHRDFGPSAQAELRYESGQPTLPENTPTPRSGPGASNKPTPKTALPKSNPAKAAEQLARLELNPSTTVDNVIERYHVPYCGDIILSNVDDLRLYLDSKKDDTDLGRTIVSVVETQILSDVNFNSIRWLKYYNAPAKARIAQCIRNGIASPLDNMVTLCVRMVDVKKEMLIEVIVDRHSGLVKLGALSAPSCTD